MTVLITLTTAGTDTGPFNLYSNLDGFTTPFETGVSKSALTSGYTSVIVPDFTSTIRITSTGVCVNFTDVIISGTTTTTTTTVAPITTTTTTIAPTTTTTTSATPSVYTFYLTTLASATRSDVCSETSFPVIVYSSSSVLISGSIVYTDSGLTNLFTGGSLWRLLSIGNKALQVDNSGVVLSNTLCS